MPRPFFKIILLTALFQLPSVSSAPAAPVPVGRAFDMGEVLIPGPELRAKPLDSNPSRAVVRIKAVYPHGTAGFRYELVVIPMVPGPLNVADFLEPADGNPPAAPLPAILLEAEGVLPPGPPSLLADPLPLNPAPVGGYSKVLPWLALGWLLLGMGLLWSLRKKAAVTAEAEAPGPAPEDRLRLLVEGALERPLNVDEKAEIERLILIRERQRLNLAGAADPAVWQALRSDPASAPWLSTLESWLHRPAGPPPAEHDLRALLQSLRPVP
ncbi:MAG: hypothetical protein JWM59_106 [Verrucomicrobiales bacterium]|nr:hypothetical protein [Verrucomicrobiales bacterium]